MSDEVTKPPTIPDNSLAPSLDYMNTKASVKFNGTCLKEDKITFTHEKT